MLGVASIHLMRFAESKVGAVDPDIMKNGCPGGKDWDLPGSSCHDGNIFHHMPPVAPSKSAEVVRKEKEKRPVVGRTNRTT